MSIKADILAIAESVPVKLKPGHPEFKKYFEANWLVIDEAGRLWWQNEIGPGLNFLTAPFLRAVPSDGLVTSDIESDGYAYAINVWTRVVHRRERGFFGVSEITMTPTDFNEYEEQCE